MENSLNQSIQARREMLAKWRQGRTHDLTLPSGLEIKVKDATIMDLMINGTIPQSLVDLMMASSTAPDGSAQSVDLSKLNGTRDFGQLVNTLVMICVVDPPIAPTGDDDHIGLDELPGDDKMTIFNWANREAAAVRDAGFPRPTWQPVDAPQPG